MVMLSRKQKHSKRTMQCNATDLQLQNRVSSIHGIEKAVWHNIIQRMPICHRCASDEVSLEE